MFLILVAVDVPYIQSVTRVFVVEPRYDIELTSDLADLSKELFVFGHVWIARRLPEIKLIEYKDSDVL